MKDFNELYPNKRNFCRVFELPKTYPSGFCFNGGMPVNMQMVDWFEPWPREDEVDVQADSWEDLTPFLLEFLISKNYVKKGREYLLITEFGESMMFAGGENEN